MNENIYDGYGGITSKLLKKKFDGFKRGEIVINSLKGTTISLDLEKYMNDTKNSEVKL
jgi:hypothetical protein